MVMEQGLYEKFRCLDWAGEFHSREHIFFLKREAKSIHFSLKKEEEDLQTRKENERTRKRKNRSYKRNAVHAFS
jgi:hypothetical protein